VIRGWAGDVMGDIELSVGGRTVLFGKRIGEVKGLKMLDLDRRGRTSAYG